MSTATQIAANQANAQLSTGPKTETGKAASSQNGWKHGLFGVFRVLNTESQMAYQDLLQSLQSEYNPATPTEAILVERMAQHHWLRNRALHYQNHYLESGDESSASQLSLFMRYESTHERAVNDINPGLHRKSLHCRAAEDDHEILIRASGGFAADCFFNGAAIQAKVFCKFGNRITRPITFINSRNRNARACYYRSSERDGRIHYNHTGAFLANEAASVSRVNG
jgi:hypothetical protein